MRKKGFTLIELLAVIVILAIIALILVPVITNIIEGVREKAAEQSVNSYIEAANNAAALSLVDNTKGINITTDSHVFVLGVDAEIAKIEYSGDAPKYAYLDFDVNSKQVNIAHFCMKDYNIDYNYGNTVKSDGAYCVTNIDNTNYATSFQLPIDEHIVLTVDDTTETINWSSTDNSIATVSSNGIVKGVALGTVNIIAVSGEKTTTFKINVTKSIASMECSVDLGKTWTFNYTGSPQEFSLPCNGIYKLEVYGASGSAAGGYSIGYKTFATADKIYIVIGGSAGYNGGGGGANGAYNNRYQGNYNGWGAQGGGATHIATMTGTLASIGSANLGKILIVAGGGGGSVSSNDGSGGVASTWYGGAGGGTNGGTSPGGSAGTQTSGGSANAYGYSGSFGQGGSNGGSGLFNIDGCNGIGGGGGGLYGGGSGTYGGGGGSGYIGGVNAFTDSQSNYFPTSTSTSSHTGNGTAIITLMQINVN